MKDALRKGWCHAVCLAVHKSVWLDIGYFQPVPKLLGYEDTMFFHEMDKAGIVGGTTGASWQHHFGSITQTAMKQERGLKQKDGLGYRYNYKLLRKSWLGRKLDKMALKRAMADWRADELARYGMTMRGRREQGQFQWD
jgi:hypothetical protein